MEGEEWGEEEGWVLGVFVWGVGDHDIEETRVLGTESTIFSYLIGALRLGG